MTDPRVPVTLLTGFLGSGKTTLLNAVLSDSSAGRVAVIVNEFGETGLDQDLIEQGSDEVILMQSGCLCCSVRGDLAQTMQRLLNQRDAGKLAFERVVIETTGLADPGPILQTLLVDRFLAQSTRMDGVVTVVDAAHGPATLDAQFEAVSQVAMADLIVLSKTDLVAPTDWVPLEERLRGLNPTANILHSVRGAGISLELWGLSGLRRNVKPDEALRWTHARTPSSDPLGNLSGLLPAASTPEAAMSPHDVRIGSASIVLDTPLPDRVFDTWLDTLVALRGPDLLRVKGIVFLEGLDAPFVFHGVQHIFDPPVQVRDWNRDDRRSRIVVIARDLTRPELQRSLDMLRAEPARLAQSELIQEVLVS